MDLTSIHFLLISGSCHGAWAWDKVLPFLNNQADTLDLPGRPGNPAPAQDVTLDRHAKSVCDSLSGPTILVGHSASGYVITAAAERDPTHIAGLIYLCAYVPETGVTLAQRRRAGPSQPLAPALRVTVDRSSFFFDPAQTAALFYHDCAPSVQASATARLSPEPIAPQETALTLTARSQSLPRAYIRCDDDRAIPPDWQTHMAAGMPLYSLPTSHSPFFSAPKALATLLQRIAQSM